MERGGGGAALCLSTTNLSGVFWSQWRRDMLCILKVNHWLLNLAPSVMWACRGHLEAHHHFFEKNLTIFLRGKKLNIFSFHPQQLEHCWHLRGFNIPMKYWSMRHISVNADGIGGEDAVRFGLLRTRVRQRRTLFHGIWGWLAGL